MKSSAKTTCRICFVVIVTLTFILWCILLAGALKHDQSDDILGSFLTVELSCIVLVIAIVQEYMFYKSTEYFLSNITTKTAKKTVFYIVVFLADLVFVALEAAYILPYVL